MKKINYQRAIAKIKTFHRDDFKGFGEQRLILENIVNYDNASSGEFEEEIIRDVFKKKSYVELSRKERKLLSEIYYFCLALEWRTISKTFGYLIKPNKRLR